MENSKADQATKTIKLIRSGRNKRLLSLIPEGQSPKLYLDLIKAQTMGVDRAGNPRPDEDLLLFLYTAKRTGLDPLTNQIYAVYRWDSKLGREKMAIQTGIDGMRLVAQRSEAYAGQDDVVFEPKDEATQYPTKATVTVYKSISGARVKFTATARWSEYVQKNAKGEPMVMWAKMPYLMLGKCAEALALRKAFPNELSGIYAKEEMAQASNILGDLPAPKKFEKPKPQVVHGRPADVGSAEAKEVTKKLTKKATKAAKKPAPNKKIDEIRAKLKAKAKEGKNAKRK